MSTEQERAEFEAWFQYERGQPARKGDGTYSPFASGCWRAWQARAALQSQHETQLQVWRSTDSCGEFWSWDEVDQYDYDHALPENRRVILIIKEG